MSRKFPSRPYPQRGLLVACSALLLLTACQGKESGEGNPPPPLPTRQVRVVQINAQATPQQNELVGTVTAVERATIAAKVTGVISTLPVSVGSAVHRGQILATISVGELNAQLAQAEAQLAQAQRNLDRDQRLLAKEAATREEVKNREEAVRLAEAGYQQAQSMASYTTVTAPFAGVIAEKFANAGDLASPGVPLLTIENNHRLQVAVPVPEGSLARIKIGDTLPVVIPAADFSGTAKVAEIAPGGDAASRTATVKLAVTAPGLHPGQFARVTMSGVATDSTITVPAAAVVTFGQMEKVFVVANQVAHLQLVRTGANREGRVEILAGLNGNEQVVTEGAAQLNDGQPVKVQP